MPREYKIWDNGKKCTIINEYVADNFEFDYLIGDEPFGILSTNLKDYFLGWRNGLMKTIEEVFDWVMREKEIRKFNFTIDDIVKSYGYDSYISLNSNEEVHIDKDIIYSTNEMKDIIMDMFESDCFDDGDLYNILNQTEFNNFIIRPFYAYIHSGISISLGDFNDSWDSGIAGVTWYEPYEELMEDAQRHFEEDFQEFNEYLQGYYNEYHIATYEKVDNMWKLEDEYWDIQKSFEDIWSNLDFEIDNLIPNFSEEDKEFVRKELIINDNKVLDYFENYLG